MRYEVDKKTFSVKVWITEGEAPDYIQPHYPDMTKWGSAKESGRWAEAVIFRAQYPEAPKHPVGKEGWEEYEIAKNEFLANLKNGV